MRFDERLPKYGWLEDLEFSRKVAAIGAVLQTDEALLVHLGASSGRTAGRQLGYSQVINPAYLRQKGLLELNRCAYLIGRCVLGNLRGFVARDRRVDRAGRLAGNWLGFRGKVDPSQLPIELEP